MNRTTTIPALLVVIALFTLACSPGATTPTRSTDSVSETKAATGSITSDGLMAHIKTLASDDFEGRAPGSPGEEKTVNYLTTEFQKLGLKPGNPDGTFIQNVPLAGFTPSPTISFSIGGKQMPLDYSKDYLARSLRYVPEVKVENSDLVFVGYGVVVPVGFRRDSRHHHPRNCTGRLWLERRRRFLDRRTG